MEKRRSTIWILCFVHLAILCNLVTAKSEYTKLFERCANDKNTFDCFKRRALDILDTAIQDNTVYKINDYISITKDAAVIARSRSMAENDTANDTQLSLDEKLDSKFYEFLSSRSLKLTIPGNAFEGRKKRNRFGYLIIAGAVMAGMMAQLAYGKIAFLAGTALLTAKMALVLSAIVGLKKLTSGGGGHEVIYATASEHHGGGGGGSGYGGGGWQRAMEVIPPT